jgi:hypothetical protein
MLSNYKQIASALEFWRAFWSQHWLTIALDGSLKNGIATFGWKIVAKGTQTLLDIPIS